MTTTIAPPANEEDPARSEPFQVVGARRSRGILLHVALFAGLIVMIGPFVWMILGSFKTTSELRQLLRVEPADLLPQHVQRRHVAEAGEELRPALRTAGQARAVEPGRHEVIEDARGIGRRAQSGNDLRAPVEHAAHVTD